MNYYLKKDGLGGTNLSLKKNINIKNFRSKYRKEKEECGENKEMFHLGSLEKVGGRMNDKEIFEKIKDDKGLKKSIIKIIYHKNGFLELIVKNHEL